MGTFPPPDVERLAAELGLLRCVVDRMPAMIAYWGTDQRCRFTTRAYEKWFAVDPEALVGRTLRSLLGPIYELNLPYIEGALRGEEQLFEREIPDPRGGPPRQSQAHYLPDVVDGEVRGFCVLVVDITRRATAEAAVSAMARKLELAERLSALGTLAAGVAHEINNPLTVVMSNVELVLDCVKERAANEAAEPVEAAALARAMTGARRVRDVVRSMQLLVGGEESSAATIDAVECLEKAIAASANTLRYRGRLVCDFQPGGRVVADSAQLMRVFVNLLMNAAHALPEERSSSNEIRVSTRLDEGDVVVEVRDNGEGIPESLVGRIFEPFFTTRDVGAGMGLGLSVSHGIVRALGGTLTFESHVGEGSRFFVRLPLARTDGEPSPPPRLRSARPRPTSEPPRRPATAQLRSGRRRAVLLVDDDPMLGEALKDVLSAWCDVPLVRDGRSAIEALAQEGAEHDLVLCDLMMPGVTGMDVFEEAIRRRPALADRFVFMTGGAFTPRSQAFVRAVGVPVLTKPFDSGVLRHIVESHGEDVCAEPSAAGSSG